MRVSDGVPKLLQVCIFTCLQVLVQFGLVVAILDTKINDFSCRLRICKV